jgi:hypothetical protein
MTSSGATKLGRGDTDAGLHNVHPAKGGCGRGRCYLKLGCGFWVRKRASRRR